MELRARLKSNRLVYHGKRGMSINELREALPREVFREVKMQGKSYWATTVLDVKKLGRVARATRS
jgi:hypothetical protein